MMRCRKFESEQGLSLVEMVIGMAGLLAIAAAAYSITDATSDLSQTTQEQSILTRKASAPVERIASELYQAQFESLAIDADAGGIVYQRVTGFVDGAVVLENAKRIAIADDPEDAPDGIDNDRDGLTDEKCITLTTDYLLPGEQTTILAQDVSVFGTGETFNGVDDDGDGLVDERGLAFSIDGLRLTVSLTMNHLRSDDEVMARTATLSFALRN